MKEKKVRDAELKVPNKNQIANDAKFMTSEEEKLRIQITRQEEIINDLRDQVARLKSDAKDGNLETVELEV